MEHLMRVLRHLLPGRPSNATLLLLALLSSQSDAAPKIERLSLYGLQIGGTTTIELHGKELAANPRLVLPIPAEVHRRGDGGEDRVVFDISLDDAAVPGIYPLRLATDRGMSKPWAVGVDHLAQRPIEESINIVPLALHGNLTGERIVRTQFAGIQGQQLVIDVESRRLGAKLKPVVRVYNEHGTQIAWSPPQPPIAGDARCTVKIPADGQYTIELHDVLRRGEAPRGIFV